MAGSANLGHGMDAIEAGSVPPVALARQPTGVGCDHASGMWGRRRQECLAQDVVSSSTCRCKGPEASIYVSQACPSKSADARLSDRSIACDPPIIVCGYPVRRTPRVFP